MSSNGCLSYNTKSRTEYSTYLTLRNHNKKEPSSCETWESNTMEEFENIRSDTNVHS
jgi:hypothetical protein